MNANGVPSLTNERASIRMSSFRRDYRATHFVILGHERSGSTMLLTTLAEHDRLQIYGELFHKRTFDRRKYFRADRCVYDPKADRIEFLPAHTFYADGENGAEFLEECVYYKRWRKERYAVGFKLFYDHARSDPGAVSIWRYLIARDDVRVLHLFRENPLHTWVSFEVAKRTDQWSLVRGEGDKPAILPPFRGDADRCRKHMASLLKWRSWAKKHFQKRVIFELCYAKDLCARTDDTLAEIQSFLNVPVRKLTVQTHKQSRMPIGAQLSNYTELREHFRNTRYEEYFD